MRFYSKLYLSWWTVGHLICSKYVERVKTFHILEIVWEVFSDRVAIYLLTFTMIWVLCNLLCLCLGFDLTGVSASVQVESLHSFTFLCSQSEESLHLQILAEFPSILVPLSSDSQVYKILLTLPVLLVVLARLFFF